MGLIGNNFVRNTGVYRSLGDVMSRTPGNSKRYSSFCNTRSQTGNTTVYSWVATPVGSDPQTSFYPPQEAGGIALRSVSSGGLSADAILEKTMSFDFTGSGDLSAEAALTIAMLCAMTGSGTLSADIAGVLNASFDFSGSGTLSADIVGIANTIVDMIGSGDLSADIVGIANASIDIVVTGTGLNVNNVGPAVWNALAALNNNPDTMGELLNSAGGGASPSIIAEAVWDELLAGHSIPGSAAEELKKKLSQVMFIALK